MRLPLKSCKKGHNEAIHIKVLSSHLFTEGKFMVSGEHDKFKS